MNLTESIHDRGAGEENKPSRKKPMYPVAEPLRHYLKAHGREVKLPVAYHNLLNYTWSTPIKDKNGKDTLWEKTSYDSREWEFIRDGLVKIYAILKTEGDLSFIKHLDVARVDYCTFGNSHPFRIRIVNKFNDNYDHYYIKVADASRIYGLELEHILSPNRITFFTHQNTLVEEHIPGIPGDVFVQQMMEKPETNRIRLAKEFVKFNERCFVRLLGDMRSYNFVVDITPDIEDYQYRIRCIDFDQQSYEGRKNLYLPQFFKENYPLVGLTLAHLNKDSIEQYQTEEKTLMAMRLASSRYRVKELLDIMTKDNISTPGKVKQLSTELATWHNNPLFLKCRSQGDIVKLNMKQMLRRNLALIPRIQSRLED
ncbi:MAG: hypothetical protein H7Y01_01900 [Ferruginibacter sp.]|nr:hypothetical protein [Chitinophagaceae bacterium]